MSHIRLSGQIRFNVESYVGYRQIVCLKNGTYVFTLPIVDVTAVNGSETTIHFSSGVIDVLQGDYMEIQVFQNSGSIVSISTISYFEVEFLDYY